MDAQCTTVSSDHLLHSLELFESSLKAKSVNEFAENGLLSLSEIMQASGGFLYLQATKHFPSRFFHKKLPPATAQSILGQMDSLLHKLSDVDESQPAFFSLPSTDITELGFHLYKFEHTRELLGVLGLASNGADLSLAPNVRGRVIDLVRQTIGKLVENEDVTHQLAHLRTYQTIGSMLKQTLDLHELLEMVLFAIMDVVSAEEASVLLLTDDKKHFTFFALGGAAKPVIGDKCFPADTGIAGSALLSRQSEIIHDVQNDPRFYKKIDAEAGSITRNMIVLPLIAGEEPVGVLEVINKDGGKSFTEKEHLLLCSIADEVAFAIRNAKVFDYIVGTYCKQRQGQSSCKGCKRPLGSWTPCVKYQESEFKKTAIVEQTIYHNLKSRGAEHRADKNSRQFDRKVVKLPAFISGVLGQEDEFEAGTILDMSLSGIRFTVPKSADTYTLPFEKSPEFSIIFILTAEQRPIKVACLAKWVSDSREDFQIGAAFVDPDSSVSQTLQKYLID